jgi:hypothetical protein
MRILLAVSLAAVLALSAVGSASAEGGATLKFTATTTLKNTSGTTFSGPITSSQLGKGIATYDSTIKGTTVTAKFTAKLKGGTLKGTTKGTVTGAGTPEDPIVLDGSGKITSGTRDFKGATGSFTYSGRGNDADGTLTLKLKGKITA